MTNPSTQERAIPISNKSYIQTNLATWKWEKRHWLLAIAIGCLVLWWFGSQMKEISGIQTIIDWLPAIGGGCFAAEAITKLIK